MKKNSKSQQTKPQPRASKPQTPFEQQLESGWLERGSSGEVETASG